MATTDDILRATLVYVIQGSSVGNLVHTYRVVSGTELDYTVIANAIETALEAAYAAVEVFIHANVSPTSLELSEWDFTDNEWDGKASVASDVPNGVQSGDGLPTGIAGVMRFPTLELRRQGRKFIPGMSEVDIVGDGLLSGVLAAMVTSAALINNDITAGAVLLRPCTFNDTVLSPRFETSSDFSTTSIVNILVGYQRRRQPGAGI